MSAVITYGITMVKDEADIIEGTLRHMASEVDRVIVADNGSRDGTRDILLRLARELDTIDIIDDPEPAYYQSRKMTNLADLAWGQARYNLNQPTVWVVPFDADEIWWHPAGRVADVLTGTTRLHPTVNVAYADLRNHFCTPLDTGDPDPFKAMVWRQRDPAPLGKVAVKWEPGAVIHQGNHGADLPSGRVDLTVLNVDHFPYRSAEQFVRKAINGAAAYRAAPDLPADMGAHWRAYGDIYDHLGEDGLRAIFREHFWHLSPIDAGLVNEPAPYRRWER